MNGGDSRSPNQEICARGRQEDPTESQCSSPTRCSDDGARRKNCRFQNRSAQQYTEPHKQAPKMNRKVPSSQVRRYQTPTRQSGTNAILATVGKYVHDTPFSTERRPRVSGIFVAGILVL